MLLSFPKRMQVEMVELPNCHPKTTVCSGPDTEETFRQDCCEICWRMPFEDEIWRLWQSRRNLEIFLENACNHSPAINATYEMFLTGFSVRVCLISEEVESKVLTLLDVQTVTSLDFKNTRMSSVTWRATDLGARHFQHVMFLQNVKLTNQTVHNEWRNWGT